MKRLLPALLGLSLLLTACPQGYKPVEVGMDDPQVLQGHWEGSLSESVYINAVATGGGRVYLGESLDTTTRFGSQSFLRVVDASNGAPLARLPLPGAMSLAYRSDGRLVVLKQEGLEVYDEVTPRLESSRPLTGDWRLSPDGRVLYTSPLADGSSRRLSTVDGMALPTVMLGKDQTILRRSSDDRWWVTEDSVMRSVDGLKLDLKNRHSAPNCANASLMLSGITTVETLPPAAGSAERLMLGYVDGFVEVRDVQGQVLNTFQVPGGQGCSWISTLWPLPDGQHVAYQRAGDTRGMGLLNLQSGAITPLPQGNLADDAINGGILTADGVLYRTRQAGKVSDGYHFVGWEGGSWALAMQDRRLTLDVRATRTGDRTADLTGTAHLNGHSLEVRGTLGSGFDAKLKPQGRMFLPELRASLTLLDDEQVVAKVAATTSLLESQPGQVSKAAAYQVFFLEQEANSIFEGQLRRP